MTRINHGKKQYVVAADGSGDFTPEEIDKITLRIATWYSSPNSGRAYPDPFEQAKKHVQEALLCETSDGRTWKRAPEDFEGRIKIKCQYDIINDVGHVSGGRVQEFGGRALDPKAKAGAGSIRSNNPAVAGFDAEKYRAKFEKEFLTDYPELDNAAHRQNVKRLSLINAQQQVIDIELSTGLRGKAREEALSALETLEKMSERTMKLMDIHPDQLRKRVSQQKEGSFSELVAKLEDDKEFLERERIWAMQAALQLWWMTQHDNGRGDGPQLEEWELWHMTRSRLINHKCECGREYPLVEGFTPQELHDYLVKRGVLVYEPLKPLVPDGAVDGMKEFFASEVDNGRGHSEEV